MIDGHALATYKLAINYKPRQNLSAKKHAFSNLFFILKYLFMSLRLLPNKNVSLSWTFPELFVLQFLCLPPATTFRQL
jgi:hypothetical protein